MFFIFTPIPILTNIFQTGWNHQLGKDDISRPKLSREIH